MFFYFLSAVLFLLPSYLIRFKVYGLPTNFLEILIVVAFIFFLLQKIREGESLKNWAEKIISDFYNEKFFFFGLLLILTGVFFSSLVSQNKLVAFGILKGWFLMPFLFFLVLYSYLKNLNQEQLQKRIRQLIASLGMSGFIYLIAFALDPLFETIYKIKSDFITFDDRLRLFFDSPNQLAMALTAIIFAFFHLQKTEKDIVKKGAYLNLMLTFIILLFLTKSLGANLAVLGAFFFYFLFSRLIVYKSQLPTHWLLSFKENSERQLTEIRTLKLRFINFIFRILSLKYFMFNTLYLTVVIAVLVPFFVTLIFNQPSENNRSSFASRVMIWQSTRAILADNLIVGIGPGNFQQKYLDYQKHFPSYLEWAVPHPHNTFLTFWASGGILGFIGFLLLIFWIINNLALNTKYEMLYTTYSILYTLYFILHSSVDTLYFKNDLSVVFWFLVALILLQKLANQGSIESIKSS